MAEGEGAATSDTILKRTTYTVTDTGSRLTR
jgi:hypothetical protein